MFGSMGQSAIKNLGNGGEMDGNVTITGDLEVQGGISLSVDEVIQGTSTIDVTNTEALLVRKNDDGGDVFVVDTTNSRVGIGGTPTVPLEVHDDEAEIAIFKRTTSAQSRIAIANSTKSAYLGLDGDEKFHIGFTQNLTNNTTFVIDDANNNIGIGTASPDNELHITDGSAGSVTANSNSQVTIESSSHASLQFLSPNNANSIIYFGDVDDNDVGYINYAHSSNTMNFQTNAVVRMSIDGSGNLTVNSGSAIQFGDSSYKIIGSTAGNYLRFYTESTQALEIDDSQNASFAGEVTVSSGIIKVIKTGSYITPSVVTPDAVVQDIATAGSRLQLLYRGGQGTSKGSVVELGGVIDDGVSATSIFGVVAGIKSNATSGDDKGTLRLATNNGTVITTALTINESQNATFAGDIQANERITFTDTNNSIASNTLTRHSNGYLYIAGGSSGLVVGNSDASVRTQYMGTTMQFETESVVRFKLDSNSRISLSNNDSGTSNTVFGKLAGDDLASGGNYNSLFGESAGHAITTGDGNVIMGHTAGDAITTQSNCTLIGQFAGSGINSTDANGSTAVGNTALWKNTSGQRNNALGFQSLAQNTTGDDNIAIGYQSLTASAESQAHRNIAIGSYALSTLNARGQDNIAIGFEALETANHADVDVNIAIGNYVLDDVGGAGVWACVGIGHNALTSVNHAGAVGSTAIGYYSLSALTSGAKNTAVGYQTGNDITIGSNNTILGYQAGATGTHDITGGSNNTLIGMQAKTNNANASNQTVIGKGATGVADNSVTLGNADVTAVYMAQDSGAKVHTAGVVTERIENSTNKFYELNGSKAVSNGVTTDLLYVDHSHNYSITLWCFSANANQGQYWGHMQTVYGGSTVTETLQKINGSLTNITVSYLNSNRALRVKVDGVDVTVYYHISGMGNSQPYEL